jgi:hypothetical protein
MTVSRSAALVFTCLAAAVVSGEYAHPGPQRIYDELNGPLTDAIAPIPRK